MGWTSDEQEVKKTGMSMSSKILIGIMACLIFIIILIIMLLMNVQGTSFSITVNGVIQETVTKDKLLITLNNKTYVNIEDFAKLVGYEYHKGEYKSSIIEEDKCYVEGKYETVSFYLNDNKIYKLPINKRDEQYQEINIDNIIKNVDENMYASLDVIAKAFNVVVEEKNNSLDIFTLDYLVKYYDVSVKSWGYTSIESLSFENQKALLYGCLIVKKEGGLYKIIDLNNTKEIALDRYTEIVFSESLQEFFVTNSSKQMGVINLNGMTKIEPMYESISVLDKDKGLYVIEQADKYGVVNSNNATIVFPEYSQIGLNNTTIENESNNKKLILDTLIPVCRDEKWGAYDINGNMILSVEYDGFGYSLTSIEINGTKKSVEPLLAIKKCNGFVVRQSGKYGLISLKGNELVQIAVDGIYAIRGNVDENSRYFMLYNGEELNVIERLIYAGLIEDTSNNKQENQIENNSIENNLE